MQILKTSRNSIKKAVQILKSGGVIVYPTETAYGLGADATNKEAIKKVYEIKGRDFKKQLPIIVSSIKTVEKYCYVSEKALLLASKFWPGPLTLVLKKKKSDLVVGNKTIALRIPANDIALALVEELGRPITSTSANLAGQSECYTVADLTRQFSNLITKKLINLVIDSGQLPKRPVSTIIDLSAKKPKILREGPIKKIELVKFVKL